MPAPKYISVVTGGHDAPPPHVVTGVLKDEQPNTIRYKQPLWFGPHERIAAAAELCTDAPRSVQVLGYPTTARTVSVETIEDGLMVTMDVDADPLPEDVRVELRALANP